MPGQRQDHLLRQIELLRQFVERIVRDHQPAQSDEALQLALNLQERLFPVPVAEFLELTALDQLHALTQHALPDDANERCLTYIELLVHTATIYELRGRDDLAHGARQLAVHLALLTVQHFPSPEARRVVGLLRGMLAPAELHAPVRQLLESFDATGD
ncbi:MAG: hypothetical protein Q8J74_13265 [Candidatus Didemnitutus sp.]|nr:hypothetical protein [Candidatus Didemnitutus sp.]